MKTSFYARMAFFVLGGFVFTAISGFAQERTAGGSLAAEASWAALQSRINKTDGDVAVIRTDINAMKACAAEKKLWLPGTGCVGPDMSLYDKMVECGDTGQVYDKSANACVSTGALRWRYLQELTPSNYYFSKFFPSYYGAPLPTVSGYGSSCSSDALNMGACTSAGQRCYSTRNANMVNHREGTTNTQGVGFIEIFQCSY